jgi:hypothetical protein
MDANCLKGFSMQGKFSNLRRNYSDMWNQILEHAPDVQGDAVVSAPFISQVGWHLDVMQQLPILNLEEPWLGI